MPSAKSNIIPFVKHSKITRQERLDSGLSYGQLTGSQLSSIIRDLEYGECHDWAELCEHMVKTDPRLQSTYSTRRDRVAGTKWVIEPDLSGPPETHEIAGRAAELVDAQLRSIDTLEQAFSDLLDGIGVGFAVSELCWNPTLGEVKLDRFEWVHQRRFVWGGRFELLLTPDGSRSRGEKLPRDKYVTHIPRELNGYPPRSGLFQSVAWYWLFKRWNTEWWLQAMERTGAPLILGKVPPNTSTAVRDEYLAQLERLSSDHVGVMEEDVAIEIMTAGTQAMSGDKPPQRAFEESMDDAMELAILGMTDATGADVNGARAATETRKDMTIDPRMVKDGKKLWATLRRDVFESMLRFNLHFFGGLMPPVPTGRFVHRDVDWDITPEVQAAGVATPNQVRQAAGLPTRDGPEDDVPFRDHGKGKGLVGEGGGLDVAAGGDVQQTALNGAQVGSLQSIVQSVALGQLPRESAVAMIEAAFPLSRLQADQIVGSAGQGFVPATPDQPVGGQAVDVPFPRAASRTTASTSSRTSARPTHPLARALSGKSVVPAKEPPRQLSIPLVR